METLTNLATRPLPRPTVIGSTPRPAAAPALPAVDAASAGPRAEALDSGREPLARPDHECPARPQHSREPRARGPLSLAVEVREGRIPAEHEIEAARGWLVPHVVVREPHALPERRFEAHGPLALVERLRPPVEGKLAQAAGWEAGSPRPCEQRVVHVGREHEHAQGREARRDREAPGEGERVRLLARGAACAPRTQRAPVGLGPRCSCRSAQAPPPTGSSDTEKTAGR